MPEKSLKERAIMDGNEAAAYVAYHLNEVLAIYPISPSTSMGEYCDKWSSQQMTNIWGSVPLVQEMQSEAGAAGAIHGALQAGSLASTFTASQGLLLMIPNMYKIAGELTPAVFHVAARSIATQSLSIFGDHSDVMAVRATGWGLLFSASVQEAMDFALIAQAISLESRIPFVHGFDGYRTSHELTDIEKLSLDDLKAMIDPGLVQAHRERALTPEHPVVRGTTQNPDTFFQAREAVNPYYASAPGIAQKVMDRFAKLTGRAYKLFDYVGPPDAERVIVIMGSGGQTAGETANYLTSQQGEKVGVVRVRLFRPFAADAFLDVLPATVRSIAVLDRTKEPGASGEPLYLDVLSAIAQGWSTRKPGAKAIRVIGGRYGLSSKEFTPAMAKAVFDEMKKDTMKNGFTIGIHDDVTHTSLAYDPHFSLGKNGLFEGVFWGLGSDGTVGANRNSIKIIGDTTPLYVQGHFVYDSKKAGSVTVSHLRFGPRRVRAPYVITQADFVGIHQFDFLDKYAVLSMAGEGATVLLNSPYDADIVWTKLPPAARRVIRKKNLRLFVIDAFHIAHACGLGGRINTIMQTGFFALSGVIPLEIAVDQIKKAIRSTYGRKGDAIVRQNEEAVDKSLGAVHEVLPMPESADENAIPARAPKEAPDFIRNFTYEVMAGRGNEIPVSLMPQDGTYPSNTAHWEKRNIADEVPVWQEALCIQCGKCVMICPHAAIRSKVYSPADLAGSPESFKSMPAKWRELDGQRYSLQVAVEDCTGCTLCVAACPVKDKTNPSIKAINMAPQRPLREAERRNWDFFLGLPDVDKTGPLVFDSVRSVQLLRPLFEFSGACAGCGETPYLKLMTQLFGDRSLVANATGCSSIYGGNLPTTPWSQDACGRGPAWSNSLFEDNAEFGLGFRLSLDQKTRTARTLLGSLRSEVGEELAQLILNAPQDSETDIVTQRERLQKLSKALSSMKSPVAQQLAALAEHLIRRSVWIVGGDGWAYDIGFGGLDHVLASGADVNVLVLDTEVYSNTGGQASKSTSRGAVAKFASQGKSGRKKDLGRIFMSYGNIYIAQVAMGANDGQSIRALREAESYRGPSIILAYSPCIEHGFQMADSVTQQKRAVESGYWPLYRYNPDLAKKGLSPMQLDCRAPQVPLADYLYSEGRYRGLKSSDPELAARLLTAAEEDARERWEFLESMTKKIPVNS